MSVYVDNACIPYHGMLMSHMIADTPGELRAMARAIGVDDTHIQNEGTAREHFDICKSKRKLALARKAIPITRQELARMLREMDYKARQLATAPQLSLFSCAEHDGQGD